MIEVGPKSSDGSFDFKSGVWKELKKLCNIWATFVRTFVKKKPFKMAQSGHTDRLHNRIKTNGPDILCWYQGVAEWKSTANSVTRLGYFERSWLQIFCTK